MVLTDIHDNPLTLFGRTSDRLGQIRKSANVRVNAQVPESTGSMPCSLVLSRQQRIAASLVCARSITDDTTELPEPNPSRNWFLCELDVCHEPADVALNTTQTCYNRKLYRSFPYMSRLHPSQSIFVHTLPTRTTESAGMEKIRLTILVTKLVGPFKGILAMLDKIKLAENEIETNYPWKEWRWSSATENVKEKPTKMETQWVQNTMDRGWPWRPTKRLHTWVERFHYVIVRHIKSSKQTKHVIRWYGYGPNTDTVEPPNHVPQNIMRIAGANWTDKRQKTTKLTTVQ